MEGSGDTSSIFIYISGMTTQLSCDCFKILLPPTISQPLQTVVQSEASVVASCEETQHPLWFEKF